MASEGPGSISHLGLCSPKCQRDPSKRFLHICKEGRSIKESGEHGRSPAREKGAKQERGSLGGWEASRWPRPGRVARFGLDTRLRIAHHTISVISVPEMWGFRSAANPAHRLK